VAGQAYFINEPEPVLLWKWIDELLGRSGLPPVTKSVSLKMAYAAGALLEALYTAGQAGGEPPMTRFLAQQLGGSHYYNVSKAQHDFGYKGIVSITEGMRRLEPELRRLAQP
jgi:hypothetical protein